MDLPIRQAIEKLHHIDLLDDINRWNIDLVNTSSARCLYQNGRLRRCFRRTSSQQLEELSRPISMVSAVLCHLSKLHLERFTHHLWFVSPLRSVIFFFTFSLFVVKSINIYFLSDYFYAISSSRSNWESIEGALLAQPDQCNSNLPSLIFDQRKFSVVTVPVLVQSHYVLVFQVTLSEPSPPSSSSSLFLLVQHEMQTFSDTQCCPV